MQRGRRVGGVLLAFVLGACSSSSTHSAPTCESNDVAACEGAEGCPGMRVCIEGTWSACECTGTTRDNSESTTTTTTTTTTSSGGATTTSTVAGTGTQTGSGGGAGLGGSGGTGASGGAGGTSSAAVGGAGGTSGGGSTATGGGGNTATGGTGGELASPVQGQVINQFRRPVDGAKVMIGTESAITDDDGTFEFASVPVEYDLYITFVNDDVDRVGDEDPQGWVYQGLTRRDPTLQVYGGLPGRSADFDVYPTVDEPSLRVIGVTLGGEYATWSRRNQSAGGSQLVTLAWDGPVTITATAHALAWEENDGLPLAYHGFDASALLLFDSTASSSQRLVLEPDLTDTSIATGTISGTASAATAGDRSNLVYVRFTSNGVIPIIDDDVGAGATNFSYLVPTLADATLTVVAQEEGNDAVAIAYQSGVSAGTTNIQLDVPAYSSLSAPEVDAPLTQDTVFRWSNDATVSVWMLRNVAVNRDYVYVVTTKKELTVPVFPDGHTNVHDDTYYVWQVETHGDFASVDEAAGDAGMMSEFNYSRLDPFWPTGPSLSSGTYTLSEWGYVNTVTE